jgi:hypothetical protein
LSLLLRQSALQAGDTIELGSTFFTHCRADRAECKGKFTLRD